jgi:type IV pilus assembly protein PilY1
MKTSIQILSCAIALTGLLTGVASNATALAERPLKASVLAKPNVIFGMDDSGSMDSEMMLYNNDGAFWWDYNAMNGWGTDAAHPNPALRTRTATWFNAAGDANTQWRKMVYLFPNGTGTGNRVYADAGNDHFAVMPTTEFAFLRWSGVYWDSGSGRYKSAPSEPELSPVHNPIYYNPLVTYKPWAPAQLSGGAIVPANATPSAVKSHRIYGTGLFDLATASGLALSTADNTVFTALPGMTIPAGSKKRACGAANNACPAGWTDVLLDEAASTTNVTRVAMAYYPATYWVKESCTVPAVKSVGTDSCTVAPDGSTLKRYEIKSGNTFPSGRTFAAEQQNFANWFQYYRKRKMMLAGAMGETMENLTGMRLGVIAFNKADDATPGNVTMYDADGLVASSNRLRVAGLFYEANGSGGTPTRETLKYIGEQYKRTDKTGAAFNVVQYSCQRNNAFIVTDGFANSSAVSGPAYDAGKSAATWGSGAPYETIYSPSLADLSLRYYTNNPRTDLATGAMQPTPTDPNINLHMNTYGLTLGARGTMFFNESSAVPTDVAAWPNPTATRSPTSVDDLWHATINGRGKMYLATTPEETALRVQAGLTDILNQEGSQGGIAVSAVNLDRGDSQAYLGSYNTAGWGGNLSANPIDINTAAVSATPNWSAAALLAARPWSERVIVTSSGASGVDFNETNVGATINPDALSYTNAEVVEYLRGNRALEGTLFRTRSSLLGAVINSEPVLARDEKMVYLASGEGMLHAFDTVTGAEQWAYVPQAAAVGMGKSVDRAWTFQTLLDATPAYARLSNGSKLLVGGMGAAGRSYYALNVSSPRGLNTASAAAQFRWTFPAASDATNAALMGYTIGKPVVTKTTAGDVVLVTSGVDNGQTIGDGLGRLWMLNATTGAVLKTFVTTVGDNAAEAGLSHVSAFREANGTVRYAYGGDLRGNIWRFDLETAGAGEHTATRVATLKDASGNTQPVTSSPELAYLGSKRIVLVGTGRLLDITDFGSTRTQSFYAIADGSALDNARTALVRQVFTRGGTPELTSNAFNWESDRGWYFDLPAGEQANTDPIVTYGAVAFVTNKNGASDCSQSSYLYLVDIGTGTKVVNSTFVSQLISENATSSRVITLRVVNGKIIGTTHRSDNTVYQRELPLGQVIPPSKNAWREVRR